MPRSLRRPLLSSVLTACFAAAVMAWGMAPTCQAGVAISHQHSAPGGQAPGHGHHHPASQVCAVHLCCVHLALGTPLAVAAPRLAHLSGHPGFAPVPALESPRPDHTLPFAHAPPPLTI
jgi:hypothetical protein